MKRSRRTTNPGVNAGIVQRKNRTDLSPTCFHPVGESPRVERYKPGFGYRHILKQRDVHDFLRLVPGWAELSRGLCAIILDCGEQECDGWYKHGVIALTAWDRALWRKFTVTGYLAHCELFERLEVPCEPTSDGYVLCKFTEASVRGYQLLHVFLHELGHHHDCMTTRAQRFSCRGEDYAEQYAWRFEAEVWGRYVRHFGLY